jgi:DNA modification methylase
VTERLAAQRKGAAPPPASGEPSARVLRGDALDVLNGLPDGFAQTCVTSPPYWGLRDYGVAARVWDGEPDCRHRWDAEGRGRFCRRCGAWKGCLGLEPDPELYVSHLVDVLREVRRVLREDGTLWLVLGDSFAAKDLLGIPWRVALALQADGWWLRSDIVWQKPNAMPESVSDRPTRAHEFFFLLTKSRRYFYDAEAVREPDQGRRSGNGYKRPERLSYGGAEAGRGSDFEWVGGAGRNRRSVWTVPTQCFKGAHFAAFPEALVEPCLLAGSSPVACRTCGAPWRGIVNSRRLLDGKTEIKGGWTQAEPLSSGRALQATGSGHWRVEVRRQTVGWEAGCSHEDPGGRCTVLDPFAGAASTGIVALRHGRDFLGIELSGAYARMARRRLRQVASAQEAGA